MAIAAAFSVLTPFAMAADGTWDSTKLTGNWSSTGNWVGSVRASGEGATATFHAATGNELKITFNQTPVTLGNITVNGVTGSSNAVSINPPGGGGANTLTLMSTLPPVIHVDGTAEAGLSLGMVLAGNQGFEKTGDGLLMLSNTSNTFTGDVVLSGGVIRSYTENALNGQTLVINATGTQWRVESGTHSSNIVLKGGDATIGGVGPAAGNGTADTILSGTISEEGETARGLHFFNTAGGAARVKRFILTGSNSYTGDTTIGHSAASDTIVRITNGQALGIGTANVVMEAGLQDGSPHGRNTLELSGGITVSDKKLTLAGKGQNRGGTEGEGSLYSLDGDNTWAGEVALGTLDNPTIGVAQGSQLTVTGLVTGSAAGSHGFTKADTGTLIFTNDNTYSGPTRINAGTLLINGAQSGNGAVTVASGARLGGSGSVAGAVTVHGTLAAGNSIGVFSSGNLSITSTGSLEVELGRTGALSNSDRIDVTGTVSLLGGADLTLTLATGLDQAENGDIFWLVNNDSTDAVSGSFTRLNGVEIDLSEGSTFDWNSQTWLITYQADMSTLTLGAGNDIAIVAIPEPEWAGLLGIGFALLLWRQRNQRRVEVTS